MEKKTVLLPCYLSVHSHTNLPVRDDSYLLHVMFSQSGKVRISMVISPYSALSLFDVVVRDAVSRISIRTASSM
jgi:hypothetical protein